MEVNKHQNMGAFGAMWLNWPIQKCLYKLEENLELKQFLETFASTELGIYV